MAAIKIQSLVQSESPTCAFATCDYPPRYPPEENNCYPKIESNQVLDILQYMQELQYHCRKTISLLDHHAIHPLSPPSLPPIPLHRAPQPLLSTFPLQRAPKPLRPIPSPKAIQPHRLRRRPRQRPQRHLLRHAPRRRLHKALEHHHHNMREERALGELLHAGSGRAGRRRPRVCSGGSEYV